MERNELLKRILCLMMVSTSSIHAVPRSKTSPRPACVNALSGPYLHGWVNKSGVPPESRWHHSYYGPMWWEQGELRISWAIGSSPCIDGPTASHVPCSYLSLACGGD